MSKDLPLDNNTNADPSKEQDEEKTSSLSSWARRKQEVQAEEEAPHREQTENETDGLTADNADEELPIPEDLKDINIEELDESFDFSRFMQEDVPEFLRHKALRQLWRTNPLLANIDGMNDYDDDFTDAAVGVEAMKGMFEKTMARLKQEEADQAEEPDQQPEKEAGEAQTTDSSVTGSGDGTDQDHIPDHPELADNSQGNQVNTSLSTEQDPSNDEPDESAKLEESNLSLLAKHGWLQI